MGRDDEPFFDGPRREWPLVWVNLYKTPFPAPSIAAPRRRSGSSPSLWISMMQEYVPAPFRRLVHPWMPDLQFADDHLMRQSRRRHRHCERKKTQ